MRVSCLTVTLPVPARLPMLRAAIDAYLRQRHADRELVIVVDAGDPAARRRIAEHVASLGRADIHVHLPDARLSLGALRNLAVRLARGALLCQWDDDDLHHPDRVAAQMAALALAGAGATILADVLLHDRDARTLYWTNWARTPAGGHPATLLCRADAPPVYPDVDRGEDLAAILALDAAGSLHRQAGAPHLYGYVAHAGNVSGAAHLRLLVETLAISPALLRRREAALRSGIAPLDLGAVTVAGPQGAAFTL